MCTKISIKICVLMSRAYFLFLHSIEFDRDFDYFAIAGVTKKIKVFHATVRVSLCCVGHVLTSV